MEKLTFEQIEAYTRIPIRTIKQNILDAKYEIEGLEALLKIYLPHPSEYKLEIKKIRNRLERRDKAIKHLNQILEYREK